jgi:hypothetical protein
MTVDNTKKQQPDMGLSLFNWKDQFPSALKIERTTLLFKWPLCSKPFTYPNNGLKYRNFFINTTVNNC